MSIIIILLILVGLYLFLVTPRIFNKPDRTAFCGVHYAHRGLFDNKSDAPENSLRAIKKAVEAGFGIEFDVQLSKDDIPVVFHDASLKRMCGVDGMVWDYTLEELQKMKLLESDETIPTFADVLEAVGGKVPLIIEYKMDRPDTKVCELGNAILETYQGPYCIESFHPFAVKWYRDHKPEIMRGQLSESFRKHNEKYRGKPLYVVLEYLLLNFLTRPDFIAYNHKDAKNFSRRLCGKMGAVKVAYTIKSQEQYEKAKNEFELFIFDSCILKN